MTRGLISITEAYTCSVDVETSNPKRKMESCGARRACTPLLRSSLSQCWALASPSPPHPNRCVSVGDSTPADARSWRRKEDSHSWGKTRMADSVRIPGGEGTHGCTLATLPPLPPEGNCAVAHRRCPPNDSRRADANARHQIRGMARTEQKKRERGFCCFTHCRGGVVPSALLRPTQHAPRRDPEES